MNDTCAICYSEGSEYFPLIAPCNRCTLAVHQRCILSCLTHSGLTSRYLKFAAAEIKSAIQMEKVSTTMPIIEKGQEIGSVNIDCIRSKSYQITYGLGSALRGSGLMYPRISLIRPSEILSTLRNGLGNRPYMCGWNVTNDYHGQQSHWRAGKHKQVIAGQCILCNGPIAMKTAGMLQLSDQIITPIINYGVRIWGILEIILITSNLYQLFVSGLIYTGLPSNVKSQIWTSSEDLKNSVGINLVCYFGCQLTSFGFRIVEVAWMSGVFEIDSVSAGTLVCWPVLKLAAKYLGKWISNELVNWYWYKKNPQLKALVNDQSKGFSGIIFNHFSKLSQSRSSFNEKNNIQYFPKTLSFVVYETISPAILGLGISGILTLMPKLKLPAKVFANKLSQIVNVFFKDFGINYQLPAINLNSRQWRPGYVDFVRHWLSLGFDKQLTLNSADSSFVMNVTGSLIIDFLMPIYEALFLMCQYEIKYPEVNVFAESVQLKGSVCL